MQGAIQFSGTCVLVLKACARFVVEYATSFHGLVQPARATGRVQSRLRPMFANNLTFAVDRF